MTNAQTIELGHIDDFRLGGLLVRPPLRQIIAPDGTGQSLEPRLVQVLVVLARADGAVVTRKDLIDTCWGGRIVGDDAVNRVILQLRRVAERMTRDSQCAGFRIDTIIGVGYRLVADETLAIETVADPEPGQGATSSKLDRRLLLAGLGGGALLALSGGILWWRTRPSKVAPLLDQANLAIQQGTTEGTEQAIGLLRRATATQPDHADAWGMLALSYAVAAQSRSDALQDDFRARAKEAADRAEALEATNPHAALSRTILIPQLGRWGEIERSLDAVAATHPDSFPLLMARGLLLLSVGRCREAAAALDRARTVSPPTPALMHSHVQSLWAAGRRDEADRAMAEAFALYPSHFAVWFMRYHLLLFTGRAREARFQVENSEGRPSGVADEDFAILAQVASAMDRQVAVGETVEAIAQGARRGAGYAENAIQYTAALGAAEAAFDIANAYFFDRGFSIGARRFSQQQRTYTHRDDRRTRFLFLPSTGSLRTDPRFDRLTLELGLAKYWQEAHVRPDFEAL